MISTVHSYGVYEACKKGDPRAQLKFYKSYYRQMFSISCKLVGDPHAADEIVRESFLVLFERVRSLTCKADLTSVLRGLVEDRSVEAWRRNNVAFPGFSTDRPIVKKLTVSQNKKS